MNCTEDIANVVISTNILAEPNITIQKCRVYRKAECSITGAKIPRFTRAYKKTTTIYIYGDPIYYSEWLSAKGHTFYNLTK